MSGKMKRRNKNNRKRGSALEKKVADYLDMFVVPYSGSNNRFGWGDLRDIEGNGIGGYWTGECKSITPKDDNQIHVIKKDWIDDAKRRAEDYCTSWFIAFSAVRSPITYIMIDEDTVLFIDKYDRHEILEKKSHNVVNYRIPKSILPGIDEIIEVRNDGDEKTMIVMRMDHFKKLIMDNRLHEKFNR